MLGDRSSSESRDRKDRSPSPGRSRALARELIFPSGGKFLHPTFTPDKRNMENDDEGDYMDMTPQSTPRRTSSHTLSMVGRSQTVQDLQVRSYSDNSIKSPFRSYRSESVLPRKAFEESEYADMTIRSSSPNSMHFGQASPLRDRSDVSAKSLYLPSTSLNRSNSQLTKPRSSTMFSQPTNSGAFDSAHSARNRQALSNSPSPHRANSRNKSPFHESSYYLKGGFDKDDNDDYETVDSMKRLNIKASNHTQTLSSDLRRPRSDSARSTRNTLPSPNKLANSPQSPHLSRNKYPSAYDSNNNNTSFNTRARVFRKRSNDMSGHVRPARIGSKKRSSSAAPSTRACNNEFSYQNHNSHFTERNHRSQSVDVSAFPSPGKIGAVRGRATLLRQHQTLRSHAEIFNESKIPSILIDSNRDVVKRVRSSSVSDISESPSTSSLLEELSRVSSSGRLQDDDERRRAKSFQNLVNKGVDGAQIMKSLLTRKEQLLDKQYIEWFSKTTPYSSREPSPSSTSRLYPSESDSDLPFEAAISVVIFENGGSNREVFLESEKIAKPFSRVPESVHAPASNTPKKKRSFWRRKKEKTTIEEIAKEDLILPEKTVAEVEAKMRKSRKSWKLKNKRKQLSISSVQTDTNALAGSAVEVTNQLETRSESFELIKCSSGHKNATSLNQPQIDHSSADERNHGDAEGCTNLSYPVNGGHENRSTIANQTNMLEFNSPGKSESTLSQLPPLQRRRHDRLSDENKAVSNDENNRTVTTLSMVQANTTTFVSPRSEKHRNHSPRQQSSVVSASKSQAGVHEDDASDSQPLSPFSRKIYGSIKSKTIGKFLFKRASTQKLLESDSVLVSSEEKEHSDFSSSPGCKKENSAFNREPLNDLQSPTFEKISVNFSTEFDANMLSHGFFFPHSTSALISTAKKEADQFQLNKQKRKSSGRKKEQHFTIYNPIKRLRNKSSELDEIELSPALEIQEEQSGIIFLHFMQQIVKLFVM